MDRVADLAIALLSVWRLTSLLHRERGPADLLVKFRKLLGVRFDVNSVPYAASNLSEGVLCFWCCSVWAATAISVFLALLGRVKWRDVPVLTLATSAGAILIDEALP